MISTTCATQPRPGPVEAHPMSIIPSAATSWQYCAMCPWRCRRVLAPLLLVFLAFACTKPVPGVCCLDSADCAAIGVSEAERECTEGLACVDHACVVPSCSTDGCSAEAPVCDITLDACTGCMGPADCEQFSDTNLCNTSSGACVECLSVLECPVERPVCNANACRECQLDTECESGACADDGSCVPEPNAVYVSPSGADAGLCSRTAPCGSINFAVTRTSGLRNHIVFETGTYVEQEIGISELATPASEIFIHGAGSTLTSNQGDGQAVLSIGIPTTVRDLEITYGPIGPAILTTSTARLERILITSQDGLEVRGGAVTARDIVIISTGVVANGTGRGIDVEEGGILNLDRATISGGVNGIRSALNTTIEGSNTLVHATGRAGIDLAQGNTVSGSINFVTIVNTGAVSTTFAGLVCSNSSFSVRSTIVWTPDANQPPTNFCNFSSTIVGPTGVVGAMNIDPQFVDETGGDYHLSALSPARDAVDLGPSLDFEGDPRPQGARMDLGADEAP